jgi:hypothetical protein
MKFGFSHSATITFLPSFCCLRDEKDFDRDHLIAKMTVDTAGKSNEKLSEYFNKPHQKR